MWLSHWFHERDREHIALVSSRYALVRLQQKLPKRTENNFTAVVKEQYYFYMKNILFSGVTSYSYDTLTFLCFQTIWIQDVSVSDFQIFWLTTNKYYSVSSSHPPTRLLLAKCLWSDLVSNLALSVFIVIRHWCEKDTEYRNIGTRSHNVYILNGRKILRRFNFVRPTIS